MPRPAASYRGARRNQWRAEKRPWRDGRTTIQFGGFALAAHASLRPIITAGKRAAAAGG